MIGHFLDRQHLAEFVDVESQAFRDPLAGGEKIQVSNPSPNMTVDPWRNTSTATADRKKTLVGTDIDPSCLCVLRNGLMGNLDSTIRKIICYTHSGHRRPPWANFLMENLFSPLELPDVHFLFEV
jgi:hypothetical protein